MTVARTAWFKDTITGEEESMVLSCRGVYRMYLSLRRMVIGGACWEGSAVSDLIQSGADDDVRTEDIFQ